MLKSVRLKNFKLHEDTSIEAALITVFIGPNNSGKSSIFQALLAIRQAALRNDRYLCQPVIRNSHGAHEPYLYPPNVVIDLGGFNDVVRAGQSEVHVEISASIAPPRPLRGVSTTDVEIGLRLRDNLLIFHKGSVRFSQGAFDWLFIYGPPRQSSASPVRLGNVTLSFGGQETFNLTVPGGVQATPGPSVPPETIVEYQELLQWLGSAPQNAIHSVRHVYALRGFEEWGVPTTDWPPTALELMALPDRAIALTNTIASDRRLKARLSERLEELLHIEIDFETVGKRLKFWCKRTDADDTDTPFQGEGSGASQLPFILVPVLMSPPNTTILLSEPEAHLHPKAQSKLTAMLIEIAKKENLQFFIETHSEHVLHRILHAVAKGDFARDEVALYYFQNLEGTAKVERLTINDKGQVDGGLPGFFDQSLTELTDYLDALRKP